MAALNVRVFYCNKSGVYRMNTKCFIFGVPHEPASLASVEFRSQRFSPEKLTLPHSVH